MRGNVCFLALALVLSGLGCEENNPGDAGDFCLESRDCKEGLSCVGLRCEVFTYCQCTQAEECVDGQCVPLFDDEILCGPENLRCGPGMICAGNVCCAEGCGDSCCTCPAELQGTHPPVFATGLVDGAVVDASAAYQTGGFKDALWRGVRRLEDPFELDCEELFITDPATLPCSVDTVIALELTSGEILEYLVGIEAERMEFIVLGEAVRLRANRDHVDAQGNNLVLESAADSRLLFASVYGQTLDYEPAVDYGPLRIERDNNYVCTYKTYMDCKHYGVAAIRVVTEAGSFRLEPGESLDAVTSAGTYHVTLRRAKDRTCFEGGNCCTDNEPDHFSYSIVAAE
jgi:hypothetical protein